MSLYPNQERIHPLKDGVPYAKWLVTQKCFEVRELRQHEAEQARLASAKDQAAERKRTAKRGAA